MSETCGEGGVSTLPTDLRKSPRLRLVGHGIRHEGKTTNDRGEWVSNDIGQGMCACGMTSPMLRDSKQRKRWHREHKLNILAGGTGHVVYEREETDDLVEYIRAIWPDKPLETLGGRGKKPLPIAERFFRYVDPQGPCWLWTGAKSDRGYGLFNRGKELGHANAHRVAWTLLVGEVPRGLEIDHLCRVRLCVNPDHLEPVDHLENLRRGFGVGSVNAAKTSCPRGHEYDWVLHTPKGLNRRCRRCSNDAASRRAK